MAGSMEILVLSLGLLASVVSCGNLMNIDDSIIYNINWKPNIEGAQEFPPADYESISMVTANKEEYACYVPRKLIVKGKPESTTPYTGPTPYELLKPLFASKTCSFKLDFYWTYQLCHGRSLRQYHEDTLTSKVSIVEFYLGKYDADSLDRDNEKYLEAAKEGTANIPTMKMNGVDHPYIAINMSYGTLCDINQKPRSTTVYYVCQEDGDSDIFTLEEATTCTYKVIVKTPFLCKHPDFKVDMAPENPITCQPSVASKIPEEGTSEVSHLPADLVKINEEDEQFRQAPAPLESGIYHVESLKNVLEAVERSLGAAFSSDENQGPSSVSSPEHLQQFLDGKFCLAGGTGWWKYEFCYGKRVTQFHMENQKRTQEIILGQWDEKKHRLWVGEKSSRKVTANPTYVRHFYDDGDYCEVTGAPRTVVVKLACKKNDRNLDAVSVFLQEPKPCQYKLTVESGIICKILTNVDENGLPGKDDSEEAELLNE